MKQHITKKQWRSLNKKEQNTLYSSFPRVFFDKDYNYFLLDIGQMIEFLGDDLIEIHNNFVEKIMSVEIVADKDNFKSWAGKQVKLCDLLFKAVKHKLKS